MKYDKSYLRKKSLIQRKKKHLIANTFNFSLIFKLIKKLPNKKQRGNIEIIKPRKINSF